MNAFNAVNLAAACIVTSAEHAEKLGIARDRWVYVLGGAGTHERDHCEDMLCVWRAAPLCWPYGADAGQSGSGLTFTAARPSASPSTPGSRPQA